VKQQREVEAEVAGNRGSKREENRRRLALFLTSRPVFNRLSSCGKRSA